MGVPWPKLAPAVAAVAIAAVVAVWAPWESDAPSLERGEVIEAMQLRDAQVGDDAITLSWAPHPTATAYRVVLYRPDLSELLQLEKTSEPMATFTIDRLPGMPDGSIVWRVIALENGDEIARSAPGHVILP